MDVRIGGVTHKADQKLLMFVLTAEDKKNIAAMPEGHDVYSCYPASVPAEDIRTRVKEFHKILKKQKIQAVKPEITKPENQGGTGGDRGLPATERRDTSPSITPYKSSLTADNKFLDKNNI